jgi:hypothetical protein
MQEAGESVLVEALVSEPTVEDLDVSVRVRLSGFDQNSSTPRVCAHSGMALPRNLLRHS